MSRPNQAAAVIHALGILLRRDDRAAELAIDAMLLALPIEVTEEAWRVVGLAHEPAPAPVPRRSSEERTRLLATFAEAHQVRLANGYGEKVIATAQRIEDSVAEPSPMLFRCCVLLGDDGLVAGIGTTWELATRSALSWWVAYLQDAAMVADGAMEAGPPADPEAHLLHYASTLHPVEVLAPTRLGLLAAVETFTGHCEMVAGFAREIRER